MSVNKSVENTNPAAKKICCLINSLEGGGAERVFSIVMTHVQAHFPGAQVEVVLLDDLPMEYVLPDGINVSTLDGKGRMLRSLWQFCGHLRGVIKAGGTKPDLVLSFLPRSNYINVLAAHWLGYRSIISERGNTTSRLGTGLKAFIETAMVKCLYRRADFCIAVSVGLKHCLVNEHGLADNKVAGICNPYPHEKIMQLAQQAPDTLIEGDYLLAVGRLQKVKKYDVLIKAYANAQIDEKLVILGQGPELASLKALVTLLQLEGKVLFPGFCANPYSIMARAKLFVLSSETEGFPNALVEAMIAGCPVIATDCKDGPGEILADDHSLQVTELKQCEYGMMVPVGDVAALSTAILAMLGDNSSALRERYKTLAAERASIYSEEYAVERYMKVISTVMAG